VLNGYPRARGSKYSWNHKKTKLVPVKILTINSKRQYFVHSFFGKFLNGKTLLGFIGKDEKDNFCGRISFSGLAG
jgi:hypothetical protein